MPSELEKKNRWWSFDTKDLLLLTAIVAVSIVALQTIDRLWSVPNFVVALCYLPITGLAVGGLANQARGSVFGMCVGGLLAMALLIAAACFYPAAFAL